MSEQAEVQGCEMSTRISQAAALTPAPARWNSLPLKDDQDADYKKVAHYTAPLQDFVRGGGKYAGFCMGAFLARGQADNETFFGLLPPRSYVSSERFERGAQVHGAQDTIVLVDWAFHTGPKKGTEEKDRWA